MPAVQGRQQLPATCLAAVEAGTQQLLTLLLDVVCSGVPALQAKQQQLLLFAAACPCTALQSMPLCALARMCRAPHVQ
jgi:hypothetical protein